MSMKMNFELLPNEIFIECFQYLNAPDIFNSFDGLNHRFSTLIRNIPLHLNFQQIKKSTFKQFCQMIISNPELKHKIISLKLSNKDTRGQIKEFLLLFPLNEFINLQSLSFIYLNSDNIRKLSSIVPFLSNLSNLALIDTNNKSTQILSALSDSKLRIISVPDINSYRISIFNQTTSLTIQRCYLYELCELFKYSSMLKYLKIEWLNDSTSTHELSKCSIEKVLSLKQLIVNLSTTDFEIVEQLLKHTPNLAIFTIRGAYNSNMIDANRWKHVIESSLSHLRIFNFHFGFRCTDFYNDTLNIFEQFQTNFWCKQHQWFTNYELTSNSALIYTCPYAWDEYTLTFNLNRYIYSKQFDYVTNLTLSTMAMIDNSPCYFKNVKSLILMNDDEQNKRILETTKIKSLNKIVNVSNLKHLGLRRVPYLLSSSLLELLKELPCVSSLSVDTYALKTFYKDSELREYLNRKINILYIGNDDNRCIKSDDVNLICKTFSNIEELHCDIEELDDLLLVLKQCSKLSIISLSRIDEDIFSWYKINVSKLNVYIDFVFVDTKMEDDFNI